MYPFDREVVVRDGQGESYTFKLLDIISDRYLVLIDKEHEDALQRLSETSEIHDEEIDLLAEEAFVIDGLKGLIMLDCDALGIVERSEHYALRLASSRWDPELPPLHGGMDGGDLTLAFDLEVAKRRRPLD